MGGFLSDCDELKQLWQISFGDSAQYVDFYFNRRYRPENTRTISVDGRIAAAAQFFPYEVSFAGEIIDGFYILGVCTHPDYRNRGYASDIIKRILEEQYAGGAELALLIPQEQGLFGFYEKQGFGGLFEVYEEHVDMADAGGLEIFNPPVDEIYEFYNRFYRSLYSAVLKTRDDFIFAVDEILVSGGSVSVCGRNGSICGFAAIEGNIVKELLYLDTAARDTILSALLDNFDSLTVITPKPHVGAIQRINGMARILRPATFLRKTVKEPVAIKITDSMFTQNSGVYTVSSGGVAFEADGVFDLSLDISELPGYFMKSSYANWLLN